MYKTEPLFVIFRFKESIDNVNWTELFKIKKNIDINYNDKGSFKICTLMKS